jgi:hypothetical protein
LAASIAAGMFLNGAESVPALLSFPDGDTYQVAACALVVIKMKINMQVVYFIGNQYFKMNIESGFSHNTHVQNVQPKQNEQKARQQQPAAENVTVVGVVGIEYHRYALVEAKL